MSDRLRPGIPDCWYSGPRGDLWVEYKFQPAVHLVTPALSELQKAWLNDRYDEGRNVAVVVGLSLKEVLWIRNKEWNTQQSVQFAIPINQLITLILSEVGTYEHANKTTIEIQRG